jgi:hypothetical protein
VLKFVATKFTDFFYLLIHALLYSRMISDYRIKFTHKYFYCCEGDGRTGKQSSNKMRSKITKKNYLLGVNYLPSMDMEGVQIRTCNAQ